MSRVGAFGQGEGCTALAREVGPIFLSLAECSERKGRWFVEYSPGGSTARVTARTKVETLFPRESGGYLSRGEIRRCCRPQRSEPQRAKNVPDRLETVHRRRRRTEEMNGLHNDRGPRLLFLRRRPKLRFFPGRIGLWRRRSGRGEMPPKEAEGPGKFPTSGECDWPEFAKLLSQKGPLQKGTATATRSGRGLWQR